MAVAVVTLRQGLGINSFAEGKYVCDAAPSNTNINCGFVPSRVEVVNATDQNVGAFWTSDMAAGTAVTLASAQVAAGGITPVLQTDGVNHGFLIGTAVTIQVASKTFTWRAYR